MMIVLINGFSNVIIFFWIGLLVLVVVWAIVVIFNFVLLEKVVWWNFCIKVLVKLFIIVWGIKVLWRILVKVLGIVVKLDKIIYKFVKK